MKFRGIAIVLLVAAFGLMSSISCAKQRTRVMTFNDHNKKGWLGVEVQDVTNRLKEKKHLAVDAGAYVSDVVDDSPAEEAGIKEGDVIVKLDDKTIDDSNDLTRIVQRIKPKTEVKVEIVRGNDKKTLSAKIGRSSAPLAYSFGFGDRDLPSLPHTPMHLHFFSQNEMNGLELQTMSKQLAEYFEVPDRNGLLITNVEKGSSAEKAGFKAGDVLTKISGDRLRDMDDLHEAIRDNEGKDANCDVIRKGKSITITWHVEADDDDDLSYDMVTPRVVPHVHPFQLEHPRLHLPDLDRLREELRDMKRQLKEKMLELKRNLRDELAVIG